MPELVWTLVWAVILGVICAVFNIGFIPQMILFTRGFILLMANPERNH